MVCPELVRNEQLIGSVDFNRFQHLHHDGKCLIVGWFKRAWDKKDYPPEEESFEPFIFAWIALNGWGSCITTLDNERGGWLDALMLDQSICQKFNSHVSDNKSPLHSYANEFHELWPIFKVQSLPRVTLPSKRIRREIVEHYLSAGRGVAKFEPKCWKRHQDAGEDVPLDWPHTLAALYFVRCNLFHGKKGYQSEMDQPIVSAAFRVLVHFLNNTGYFKDAMRECQNEFNRRNKGETFSVSL